MERLKYAVLIFLTLNYLPCLGQQLKINATIPAYLIQGDHIEFKVELSNQLDSEVTGQVQLELIDSLNQQSVDGWLMNIFPNQYFTIAVGKTETILFPIQIPPQFNRILKWRCSARLGSNINTNKNQTIQQEGILPVLTNRIDDANKIKEQNGIRLRKLITTKFSTLNTSSIRCGDTIRIKLEVICNRDFRNVVLTDVPPAGLNPVLNSKREKSLDNNLYRQSNFDNRCYFYLDHLKKGKNIIEYQVVARFNGTFNFGISTLDLTDVHKKIQYSTDETITIE